MTDTVIAALAAFTITTTLCFTLLRAWHGWLELKRLQIERHYPGDAPDDDVGLRIELAAVKERLKKLEAIASGVEL